MKSNRQSISQARASFFECFSMCMLLVPVFFMLSGQANAQSTPTVTPTPGSFFPLGPTTVSTMPSNGDVNPYGVAFIPSGFPTNGAVQPNDILVSNYNNSANVMGTGTTITRITSRGVASTFFQGTASGLTAALGVLQAGYVFVGSLPTTDGTPATLQPGAILLLDRNGKQIGGLSGTNFVNGPWGMALYDFGTGFATMFVSNVLDGSIVRFDMAYTPTGGLQVFNQVKIATGFNFRTDPAALVLGPSGLAFDAANDILYIANSADNTIYKIIGALTIESPGGPGTPVYSDTTHLHGPLDLTLLPDGNLITANSDGNNVDPNQPSEIVEFTTAGKFVSQMSVDMENGGAFGMAVTSAGPGLLRFAAIDDNAVTLTMWLTSPTN